MLSSQKLDPQCSSYSRCRATMSLCQVCLFEFLPREAKHSLCGVCCCFASLVVWICLFNLKLPTLPALLSEPPCLFEKTRLASCLFHYSAPGNCRQSQVCCVKYSNKIVLKSFPLSPFLNSIKETKSSKKGPQFP